MANRTIYTGTTYPPVELQVSDETGVLDLSTADSLEAVFVGSTATFSGPGTAIQPPTVDADGQHKWNCSYTFASGDTAVADQYAIWLKVTWQVGPPAEVEWFATKDTLTILAAPSVS